MADFLHILSLEYSGNAWFLITSTFLYLWTVLACEDGKTKEPDMGQLPTACEVAGCWWDENDSWATHDSIET